MKIKLEKGFKQFLWKTAIFIGLFMVFIFLVGINLYKYNILYGFDIYIYGRVGYILLFSIAGFILLYRERLMKIESFGYKARDFLLLILSFVFLLGFYAFEIYAYKIPLNLMNIILIHILGVSIFVFLALGVYGLSFIKNFFKKFKKELGYFLIFGIITASLMNFVWNLWPYFSAVVLKLTAFLLRVIGADFKIIEPDIIIVKNFAAKIAEACSGVYSIFLFSALYLFIIFLDWKKINKKRAAALFIPAVAGAFFVNVLRVFLLFVVGGYVSKELAMGLYHSYTGMIFFLAYFTVFWFLFYKWMKDEKISFSFIPKDPLYRNSIYLMLGTLIMAILGFIFWMIGARLFTTEQVGLATTLISVIGLITSFSLLGLNTGLIRYLPAAENKESQSQQAAGYSLSLKLGNNCRSKLRGITTPSLSNKDKKINTSFALVAIVTIMISSIFLLSIKTLSPKLMFVHNNIILAFVFIFFMVFASFNSLVDSVFIAYRSAKYVLLKNTIFSSLKILLLFAFVGLGAYGIFSAHMLALIIGFITVFLILIFKFNYKPRFVLYDSIIKKIGRYSFGNYIAGFIGGVPAMLLPLLILNKLGAEASAYYYISMMIAALLFAVPQATANSLFAEGSYITDALNTENCKFSVCPTAIKNAVVHNRKRPLSSKRLEAETECVCYNEERVKEQVKKSAKIIGALLIPAILLVMLWGKYVLLIFGENYAAEGAGLLKLFAFSGIFVSINSISNSILRVKKKIRIIANMSFITALVIVVISYAFITRDFGLRGIGYAWISGHALASIIYLGLFFKHKVYNHREAFI